MRRAPSVILVLGLAYVGAAWWLQARAAGAAPGPHARPAPAPTRKFDEYGNVRWEDEQPRLDNFAIALQEDPTAQGYLICYGGSVGRAGEARRRCTRAKGYLSGYRRIPAEQVVTVDGGYREELVVEVWVVPRGAVPPQPTPTVDAADVRFVKGDAKKRVRRRGRARRT